MDNYNTASQEAAVEDDWKWEEWYYMQIIHYKKMIQSNTAAKKEMSLESTNLICFELITS